MAAIYLHLAVPYASVTFWWHCSACQYNTIARCKGKIIISVCILNDLATRYSRTVDGRYRFGINISKRRVDIVVFVLWSELEFLFECSDFGERTRQVGNCFISR